MQWRTVGLSALCLVTMTGCPEEFGKEGRVNKAVHKDALELIQKPCTREDFERYCEGGRENSEQCRQACGG
jgi:hypothetical protein